MTIEDNTMRSSSRAQNLIYISFYQGTAAREWIIIKRQSVSFTYPIIYLGLASASWLTLCLNLSTQSEVKVKSSVCLQNHTLMWDRAFEQQK